MNERLFVCIRFEITEYGASSSYADSLQKPDFWDWLRYKFPHKIIKGHADGKNWHRLWNGWILEDHLIKKD